MAYSLEEAFQLSVEHIAQLEDRFHNRSPQELCDRTYLYKVWTDQWSLTAMPQSYPGGEESYWPYSNFRFSAEDFEHLGLLGFKISCDGYAKVLNEILASKGCCYRLSCNTADPRT